jgi:hypothetical protein
MFELLCNYATPSGKSSAYVGPDGVQCSHGLSVFRNTFLSRPTTLYTSDQHTDDLQATGNYLKIYENEFINVGDSIFDYDCYANANPHDVWIYNNVFRITNSFDRYPSTSASMPRSIPSVRSPISRFSTIPSLTTTFPTG